MLISLSDISVSTEAANPSFKTIHKVKTINKNRKFIKERILFTVRLSLD